MAVAQMIDGLVERGLVECCGFHRFHSLLVTHA
jgi:hypothetical protein